MDAHAIATGAPSCPRQSAHRGLAWPEYRLLAGPREDLRLSCRSAVVLAIYGATLLLTNLGSGRVLTYHEVYFAQPAKEMLASRNFVVPAINGIPSTDKPPAVHWMIALSMHALGSGAEWVVRLPSVIAALTTALAIAVMAARWFGDRVALVAGLMQLTALYVLMQARLAEADMPLCAAVTIAMCAFSFANVDSPHGRARTRLAAWMFFAATGLAFLIKGPIGPALIGSGCALFLFIQQDFRAVRFFLDPLGLAILAFCVLAWPLAAYAQYTPILEDWWLDHMGRIAGQLGGEKPLGFYFYTIPMLLIPWTPLAVLATVGGLREGRFGLPIWRFLACWFVAGLVLLSASKFQHKHYAIPLLPPLSIAGALAFVHFAGRMRRWPAHASIVVVATMAGLGASAVVLVQYVVTKAPTAIDVLLCVVVAAGICYVLGRNRLRFSSQLALVFGTMWIVGVGVQTWVMPSHDSYRHQRELAERINRRLPRGQPLYMVNLPENQISYYLAPPVVRWDDGAQAGDRLVAAPARVAYVLAPSWAAEHLARYGDIEILDRTSTIRHVQTPRDRLTLIRFTQRAFAASRSTDAHH